MLKNQFCIFFFLIACSSDKQAAVTESPERQEYNKKLLEAAQTKEKELQKKAKQAEVQGLSTPIGQSPSTPQQTAVPQPTTPTASSSQPRPPVVQKPITPVCQRTSVIRYFILKKSQKTDCRKVTLEDLQSIVVLDIGAPFKGARFYERFITRSLKSGDFSGLTSLEILNLREALILEPLSLPEGIFDGLISLKTLKLDGNTIYSLPPNVFSELINLEDLDFSQSSGYSESKYGALSSTMFDNLRSLKYLRVTGNFSLVPEGIFKNLNALKELTFFGRIRTFPSGLFSTLTSLEYLNTGTYYTEIKTLPQGIFSNLTAIKKVRLRDIGLESLPPRLFHGLNLLENLDLSDNKLTSIPPGTFQGLARLKELDLAGNLLISLPEGVFNGLSSLEVLLLRRNHNLNLPPGMLSELPSLKIIELAHTNMSVSKDYERIKRELQYLPEMPDISL